MKLLHRIGGPLTMLRRARSQNDYVGLHREAFDTEPYPLQDWIHFPFAWGSPEAADLQSTIWKIESQVWKQFLTNVRDERIQGDLVEFGVSAGYSLGQLIGYCEDLALKINIYGFDSFEGLPELSTCDPPYWHKGQFAASYEAVSQRLKTDVRPHVRLVKGGFPRRSRIPASRSLSARSRSPASIATCINPRSSASPSSKIGSATARISVSTIGPTIRKPARLKRSSSSSIGRNTNLFSNLFAV